MRKSGILLIALLLGAAPLWAHGKGRLKLGTQQVAPGGSVMMSGTEFAKNELFSIYLVGAAGRARVGEIRSDTAGKFNTTITAPADLTPGSYRIVLEASDDDEVASANVQVAASLAAADEHAGHDMEPVPEGSATATAEPLELERARSPAVTGGALIGIVTALALGVLLLRRNGLG